MSIAPTVPTSQNLSAPFGEISGLSLFVFSALDLWVKAAVSLC